MPGTNTTGKDRNTRKDNNPKRSRTRLRLKGKIDEDKLKKTFYTFCELNKIDYLFMYCSYDEVKNESLVNFMPMEIVIEELRQLSSNPHSCRQSVECLQLGVEEFEFVDANKINPPLELKADGKHILLWRDSEKDDKKASQNSSNYWSNPCLSAMISDSPEDGNHSDEEKRAISDFRRKVNESYRNTSSARRVIIHYNGKIPPPPSSKSSSRNDKEYAERYCKHDDFYESFIRPAKHAISDFYNNEAMSRHFRPITMGDRRKLRDLITITSLCSNDDSNFRIQITCDCRCVDPLILEQCAVHFLCEKIMDAIDAISIVRKHGSLTKLARDLDNLRDYVEKELQNES